MSVSILLPYFNAAPWIIETISSIQSQSAEDWELICVNDFSTDGSETLVQEIALTDNRVKNLSNVNKGIIPALQLALSKANGTYITRMDADDLMTKNRLKLMNSKLDTLPERSIVTGKVRYFSDGELSDGFVKYEHWINERVDLKDHYKHIYRECVVASPNWMARKSEIIELELFEKLVYPEDYDLVFHWQENGVQIHAINEVTLEWRDHPSRTSKNSETYSQEELFKLKTNWFLNNRKKNGTLALLGAGTKGKLVAKILDANHIRYRWYDFNFKKYQGKPGANIEDYSQLDESEVLVTIYPQRRDELEAFLTTKGYDFGVNAWYF
jgi:glycosyltransferase involved in cell wall biosynthesis